MAEKHSWERRIERAEELAQCLPHAQDVLTFYSEVLKWQRDLFNFITAKSVNQELTGYFEHDQALVYDPDVLLLDEPFGALDAMTREQMQLELLHLWANANKTAIMITHSIMEAVFVADRVFVMSHRPGRISAEIAIPLPRPRRLDMVHDPDFGVLARAIRNNIQDTLES